MTHRPSPQQQAIYEAVTNTADSLRVLAVAGAGKTTTLVGAVGRMKGAVALCAYNKAIAAEIQTRIAANPRAKAGTFHSFGMAAVMRNSITKPALNANKVRQWCVTAGVPADRIPFVTQLVSLAKQRAHADPRVDQLFDIVEHFQLEDQLPAGTLLDDAVAVAQDALAKTTAMEGVIDFDDMIYLPLVRGLRVPQYDWVLVDEAQDTNPARRLLAAAMLKPGGRLVAVGDPHQAIYGFTGADSDALDLIKDEFRCVDFPLTVTYRCPKAVVRLAQQYVSHIQAADSAPEGVTRTITEPELLKQAFRPTDAILCRLTKPLVQTAFALLARGIACRVEGRDIGIGLVKLLQRFRKAATVEQLVDALNDWSVREAAKYDALDEPAKAEAVRDRCDTLVTIAERFGPAEPVAVVHNEIHRLFADTAPGERATVLTLSTVHKAKGREWPRVFLLGRNRLMPSKWARQEWQQAQEVNLIYVALTRAQEELIDVEL